MRTTKQLYECLDLDYISVEATFKCSLFTKIGRREQPQSIRLWNKVPSPLLQKTLPVDNVMDEKCDVANKNSASEAPERDSCKPNSAVCNAGWSCRSQVFLITRIPTRSKRLLAGELNRRGGLEGGRTSMIFLRGDGGAMWLYRWRMTKQN